MGFRSLESKAAWRYYDYNAGLHTYMGSGALMITPQVEMIRDQKGQLLDATAIVSDLFYRALKELDYNRYREKDLFRNIDFAVLDRTREQYNYKEFYRHFGFDHCFRDEDRQAAETE